MWTSVMLLGIFTLLPVALSLPPGPGNTNDVSGQPSGAMNADYDAHSRERRAIVDGHRWTKAIVPYDDYYEDELTPYELNEIQRAQRAYERLTCFRFKPWVNDSGVTTNDKLELGHTNYLIFFQGGCWSSYIGRKTGEQGQGISCCGSGLACIHEIGHALGLNHEQGSPDPARQWMIRMNEQTIGRYQFREHEHSLVGYDITSQMHYEDWEWARGGKPTFTKLYPEQKTTNGIHYLMMEVSLAHECETLHCRDSSLVCENDGYLTLVDGKCACKCVPGLDPDTGCTSILRSTSSTQSWPKGSYSLPQPKNGCADSNAKQGSRTHYTDGGNSVSQRFDVAGGITGNGVEHTFCTTEGSTSQDVWPSGNYCIYRKGGACPDRFKEGFVQYDDRKESASSVSGSVPDGVFDTNTRIEFCCRYDGFSWIPVFLPNRNPFVLIKNNERGCQSVRGMHVYNEFVKVTNSNDEKKADYGGEDQPFGKIKGNVYKTSLCHYEPATIDCGGYIELSKDKLTATISSPQDGTELECTWFIKGPENEHVRLQFESFNIASDADNEKDKLEIRYFRPGQEGMMYTGNKMDQTIQSVNNTIAITLSTFGKSTSSFKAKVTLTLNEDLCYNVADRGTSYAGNVNFTRWFENCLPWTEVTHCPHHPYVMSETDFDHTRLEGNYCRNPDYVSGIMPWCYTKADGCERNYCDPCLFGETYDTITTCDSKSKRGFCDKTELGLSSDAISQCAKTCGFVMPMAPPKAKDITCSTPSSVVDGSIVKHGDRTTYAVGDIVMYKCNADNQVTKSRVCLTSGHWSDMGFVCSGCPHGWHLDINTDTCFGLIKEEVTQQEAINGCAAQGWTIATAKNEAENSLVNKLFPESTLWLPIKDSLNEGTWVWNDDEVSEWVNWEADAPDNWGGNGQDCAYMRANGKWNDISCKYETRYVCKKPKLTVCSDYTDQCQVLLASDPTMCNAHKGFGQEYCPKTCGLCEDGPVHCDVVQPTNGYVSSSESRVAQSSVLEYGCDLAILSGDLVRECLSTGRLSGEPLVCGRCPVDWTYFPENNKCVRYFTQQVDFETATSECFDHGGLLAMPKSSVINSRLVDLIRIKRVKKGNTWIGLDDQKVEGSFTWADGKLLNKDFTNWKRREPNNYGGHENCVQFKQTGVWTDVGCWKSRSYVCEIHLSR